MSALTVFTAHPVMGGETCHYAHLTVHCLSLVTLEGGYDKARIPSSRGFDLIRPTLTLPRPGLDAQHSSIGKEGQYGTVLQVISSSHPRRHHGVQEWPTILRARRYSHLNRDRQNIVSRLLGALASSDPIKKTGQDPTRGHGQQARHKSEAKYQQPEAPNTEINISSNHLCTLFSFSETWARCPLSQACDPYTSTSVQGNTNSPPPAGRRAFSYPNQDKPPCVLLASPSRLGTRSTHSSV
jgi:hypothetical protein